jgi:hypothetical protein
MEMPTAAAALPQVSGSSSRTIALIFYWFILSMVFFDPTEQYLGDGPQHLDSCAIFPSIFPPNVTTALNSLTDMKGSHSARPAPAVSNSIQQHLMA